MKQRKPESLKRKTPDKSAIFNKAVLVLKIVLHKYLVLFEETLMSLFVQSSAEGRGKKLPAIAGVFYVEMTALATSK